MASELVVMGQSSVELNFTQEKVQLIKDTICKGATDNELQLFLEVCRIKGLDPLAKQIHAVKRWDNTLKREVMSHQVGIDGFRLVAERTGRYAGQDEPLWCGEDGVWRDVWLKKEAPQAAKVAVYKKGFEKPLSRVALYREYVQTTREGAPNSMWSKMPTNQLAKCAEALALRAAFPEELSGLYTPDEMGQADNPQEGKAAQREVVDRKLSEASKEEYDQTLPSLEEFTKNLRGANRVRINNVLKSLATQLGIVFGNRSTEVLSGILKDYDVANSKDLDDERAKQLAVQLFNRIQAHAEGTDVVEEIPPDALLVLWEEMVDIATTVNVFQRVKDELTAIVGDIDSEKIYRAALRRQGIEKSNQFRGDKAKGARPALKEIFEHLQIAKKQSEGEEVTDNDIPS